MVTEGNACGAISCAIVQIRTVYQEIAPPSARNDRGSGDMALLIFSGGHWGTAQGPFPTFFHEKTARLMTGGS